MGESWNSSNPILPIPAKINAKKGDFQNFIYGMHA